MDTDYKEKSEVTKKRRIKTKLGPPIQPKEKSSDIYTTFDGLLDPGKFLADFCRLCDDNGAPNLEELYKNPQAFTDSLNRALAINTSRFIEVFNKKKKGL